MRVNPKSNLFSRKVTPKDDPYRKRPLVSPKRSTIVSVNSKRFVTSLDLGGAVPPTAEPGTVEAT